ncbi:hypothetical protein BH23GEM4_BH23GEM4_24700 [soil metagenome]
MRNTLRKARSNKGFTLIELMIVVVIIGILAAIAIPKFGQASARAKEKEADGILKQIYTLQQAYYANNGAYATAFIPELQAVGWEAPTGLKHFAAPGTPGFPVTMTKTGSGYCNRQITVQGEISSTGC